MILEGPAIRVAMNRTSHPIELRDKTGKRVKTLDPAMVLEYVARCYECHGTKRRLRYLKPPMPKADMRPELPFVKSWLSVEAAVLRFPEVSA